MTRLVLFGTDAAGTFLVTDACAAASTLADVIRPEGNDRVPASDARLVLLPLAGALGALSRARLVHGEIRPEHVFVHAAPGHPVVVQLGGFVRLPRPAPEVLADFDLMGRPPEQIRSHRIGATTDVYAVAAIAFALLFGRPPFPLDSREALLFAKHDPGFDPLEGLGEIPAEVAHLFRNALASEPDERFDAGGFSHALVAALDALERPERARERHERTPERHERTPERHERAPERDEPVPRREDDAAADSRRAGGRPPRFHRSAATRTLPPEPDIEAVPVTSERAGRHETHASTTQQLSTRELENLASRRGTPRMHTRKG
jgi:serine/threonine protein kinase